MKKIIMALVCATMSLTLMAQPKNNTVQPKHECAQCGQMQCRQHRMMPQAMGDVRLLKQAGLDSTKIKQVMELRKQNMKAQMDLRKKYKEDFRKLLGDEAYIKYLEAKVAQKNAKKFMTKRQKARKGMMRQKMSGHRPMMGRPGMQGCPMGAMQNCSMNGKQKPDASKDSKAKKDTKSKKSKK